MTGNHPCNKILQFTRRYVVRHQPNTDTRASKIKVSSHYDPIGTRVGWWRYVCLFESVRDSLTAGLWIIIGIHQDTHRLPPRSLDVQGNGRTKIVETFLFQYRKPEPELGSPTNLADNMLVVLSLNQ